MIAMLVNILAETTNESAIISVAFSPDGAKILSGSWDQKIKVWDAGAPEPLKSRLLGQN